MQRRIRLRHLSYATERSYLAWLDRFAAFVARPPSELGQPDVEAFLTHLAVEGGVSPSTQNQAFSAVLFLFKHVLRRELHGVDALRARPRRRLPVVLSADEVQRVVAALPERFALMARLIYGAGLRLQECLELRVKDVDVARGVLTVRSGKGDMDRRTVMPTSLHDAWGVHEAKIHPVHDEDRSRGLPGVALPLALERKYPRAGEEWAWFWAFPAADVSTDPRSGIVRRHHQHPSAFQKAFKAAVREAGIAKPATIHTAPQFRDTSSGGGHGHPDDPGAVGPQGCQDDDDLHACSGEEPAWGPIAAGCVVAGCVAITRTGLLQRGRFTPPLP